MKQIQFVDLQRQYKTIKKEVDAVVKKVLTKGDFILGEEVGLFEKAFAQYCGTKYAVGVASGADALLLSMRALGITRGDEVIAPVNTFISSVLPVAYLGAKTVFVDNDPSTYNIAISQIEKKITKKTKAIIVVHLYGQIADMDAIRVLAKKYKLFIIEDAAQAHGATYKGRKAGSFGDIGCYSFYPGKNLGAAGDGGMVITNDAVLAEKVKMLRHIGQRQKYIHDEKGYNSRLDTKQAAILRVKLRYLDTWTEERRKIAWFYTQHLAGVDVVRPIEETDGKSCYYVFVLRSKKRDALVSFLKQHGVSCILHYPVPLHLQPAFNELHYKKGDFPIAEQYAQEILSLPVFPELTQREQLYIVKTIKKFYADQK